MFFTAKIAHEIIGVLKMLFNDYVWVKGKPRGKSPILPQDASNGTSYKIVKDPYGKRISIERLERGIFQDIIYDSNLFDFRVLIAKFESSWQKINHDKGTLIRDHDDRTIAEEFYVFEKGLCTECRIHYPKGPLVAIQKMIYGKENNLIAMVLYDVLDHPAGLKMVDAKAVCTFESWDMADKTVQEKLKII